MPAFSRDGKFDKQTYERVLDRINMSPAAFEANQREFLLRQKLERLVRDSVAVVDAELQAAYTQKNPAAKPGEFEKNKESFRQTYLAEKQRDAYCVSGISRTGPRKTDDKALAS
jgi:peptidyl-prolyl cis-trans isomerase D